MFKVNNVKLNKAYEKPIGNISWILRVQVVLSQLAFFVCLFLYKGEMYGIFRKV